jgi:hypothetical protein
MSAFFVVLIKVLLVLSKRFFDEETLIITKTLGGFIMRGEDFGVIKSIRISAFLIVESSHSCG